MAAALASSMSAGSLEDYLDGNLASGLCGRFRLYSRFFFKEARERRGSMPFQQLSGGGNARMDGR